eukprot:TRINITY_DN4626_c0_g1_i4.p1 TRINITY_DN4626_c0_g1~~TRINITY_DN4626_c0_g1_i4.p1  ORF type:complete len:153 (-),score=24.52 TRINITY_DN4626_c0_g1_i4:278-736(-)
MKFTWMTALLLAMAMTIVVFLQGCSDDADKTEVSSAGNLSSAAAACGGGDFPSGKNCYQGSFLTETLQVMLSGQHHGNGTVSMWAEGPRNGSCVHKTFSKQGTGIVIANLSSCPELDSLDFTIQYCSIPDEILVRITVPMEATIHLLSRSCS